MSRFTSDDIPPQHGKTIVITGANSGLGLESTKALAKKGARVIMACRDPRKAEQALASIRAEQPDAKLELLALDLASLASVRKAAAELRARAPRIDVLLNNAGVMAVPYEKSPDGFEMHMAINHFGHFALTALVFDLLRQVSGARVINVSSGMHLLGRMRFHDLAWERRYAKWEAYAMSKLANLLFTYELDRRLRAKGIDMRSVAAHPGYAATNLQTAGLERSASKLTNAVMRVFNPVFGQPAHMGALPQLYAATAHDVRSGEYFGPHALGRGYPVRARSNARSQRAEDQQRLWALSEELTGAHFDALL